MVLRPALSSERGAADSLEVEVKAPVPDPLGLVRAIRRQGGRSHGVLRQSDRYFNHPQRDFARTDEALRIRTTRARTSRGWGTPETVITYKGPKLDRLSKTRREIEFAVGPAIGEILRRLRFREVATVHKVRQRFLLGSFEVLVDRVRGVGNYVEVEWHGRAVSVAQARDSILALLRRFGIEGNERRSYLELLLERRGKARGRRRAIAGRLRSS